MRGGKRENSGPEPATIDAPTPPPIPPGPLTRDTRRRICDLADRGHGQSAIARYLGLTRSRVRTVLKRNGKLRGATLLRLSAVPNR